MAKKSVLIERHCRQFHHLSTGTLTMDHWPWIPELKGIFLSLMHEEIFENGSNII